MAVYQPTYKDKNTGEWKKSKTWWYEFIYAGRSIRESAKTHSKTVAKEAEKKRHRELELGYNNLKTAVKCASRRSPRSLRRIWKTTD